MPLPAQVDLILSQFVGARPLPRRHLLMVGTPEPGKKAALFSARDGRRRCRRPDLPTSNPPLFLSVSTASLHIKAAAAGTRVAASSWSHVHGRNGKYLADLDLEPYFALNIFRMGTRLVVSIISVCCSVWQFAGHMPHFY